VHRPTANQPLSLEAERVGAAAVVVDLTDVSVIDSGGLRALVELG
jgi:anti-anti-sigma regulatory factor